MKWALQSPAKVNLCLRIVGLRADGYHLLNMINAPVALADTVEIELTPGPVEVTIETVGGADYIGGLPIELNSLAGNIAAKAAVAVLQARGGAARVHIKISKKIPLGGGLGGGSSNAAAVISCLSGLGAEELSGLGRALTLAEQMAIGLTLGADVPYFIAARHQGSGWAAVRGIGEIVDSLPAPVWAPMPCLFLLPGVGVSTVAAYRAFDAAVNVPRSPSVEPESWAKALGAWNTFQAQMVNDLESVVGEMTPAVGRCLDAVRAQPDLVGFMTGSGSTVVAMPKKAGSTGKFQALRAWASQESVKVIETEVLDTLQKSKTIGSV